MWGLSVYMKNKLVAFFLILSFLCSSIFPVSYSGSSTNSIQYSGYLLSPVDVEGIELYPISNCGSVINGIYYEGINLKESKIIVHTITGHEQSSDFFKSSVPNQYRVDWPKVIGKYAIGTTVVVITGIITLATGAETGFIAAASFEEAIKGAVLGACTDALITGALCALKGNTKQQIFKETIEASADGFMWGAIIGAVTGGLKGTSQLKKGTPVLNSKGKIINLVNENNEVVIAKTGRIVKGSRVLPSTKDGVPKYYTVGNKLYDFDNRVICNEIKVYKDGRLPAGLVYDSTNSNNLFGYIDNSGILHTETKDIVATFQKEWSSVLGKHVEGSYEYLQLGKDGSGSILKYNYCRFYNEQIPKYAQGHHLVPSNIDDDGKVCRLVFEKFEIDINDPHNCVLLPDDPFRAKALNTMQHHKDMHGVNQNKLLAALSEELSRAKSKEQVFEILEEFRQAILSNNPFWI